MAHVGKVSMDGERELGSCDHGDTLSDLGIGDVREGYGCCVIDASRVGHAVFSRLQTCQGIIKCKNMQIFTG